MSFGNKVGRVIGAAGALAVEGAVRGATGLGQFGSDLVDGVEQGYVEKTESLVISRTERAAKLEALKAKMLAERSAPITAPKTAKVKG